MHLVGSIQPARAETKSWWFLVLRKTDDEFYYYFFFSGISQNSDSPNWRASYA